MEWDVYSSGSWETLLPSKVLDIRIHFKSLKFSDESHIDSLAIEKGPEAEWIILVIDGGGSSLSAAVITVTSIA